MDERLHSFSGLPARPSSRVAGLWFHLTAVPDRVPRCRAAAPPAPPAGAARACPVRAAAGPLATVASQPGRVRAPPPAGHQDQVLTEALPLPHEQQKVPAMATSFWSIARNKEEDDAIYSFATETKLAAVYPF